MKRILARPASLLKGFKLANAAMSLIMGVFFCILLLSSLNCQMPMAPAEPMSADDSLAIAALFKANHQSWPTTTGFMSRDYSTGRVDHLYLSDMHFDTLPPEIGDIRYLKALHLDRNALRSLPHEIEKLLDLEELTAGGNKLVTLPDGLRLTHLRNLDLSSNQIQALPVNVDLTALETVNLEHNQIRALPPDFKYLRRLVSLYMSDNRLESLPSPIDELVALKWLDVSKNSLASMPDGITQLHLDFLDVGSNHLCFANPAEGDSAAAELAQWLDETDRDWRTTQKCP
jgi:hypothetical protein